MDAELFQARLQCRILEAEKETETIRADKYLNIILGTLACKCAFGATQLEPEASHVLRAATTSASARRTSPAAISLSGPAIARGSSVNPSMVGRRRDLSSTENPNAPSSKRTRRFYNVPQSCDTRALVPPGQDDFGVDVEGILEGADLTPLVLTRAEVACAEGTPGINWAMFIKTFGGNGNLEWPQCSKIAGYENFIRTGSVAQPFMPLSPGRPGLLLRLPSYIKTPQSDHDESTYHVFSATHSTGTLHYRGKYATIPLPQIQLTWTNTPRKFRERWIRRVTAGTSPDMREARARINLRNRTRREPSASEVQAYMGKSEARVTYKVVSAAFRSGKEKLAVEGLACVEYDSHLATIIQRAVDANNM